MSSFLDVYPVLYWGYCKSLCCNSKIEFLWFHGLSNFHIHLVLYHQKNNLEILWFSHFELSLFSYNFPCSSEYLLFAQQAVWVLKSNVFGQKSTVFKWKHCILRIHPLTGCQKVSKSDFQSVVSKSKIYFLKTSIFKPLYY